MTLLESRIRAILMSEWDPIGVRGVAQAQDEYDDYVGPLAVLVRNGAAPDRIADDLLAVEIDRMGLVGEPDRAQRVALRLHALKP
ncbi:MAG: hypothetical protein ACT6XY_20680 [Phreatobacter sp.]|jgi:hypothetical protein|uniref:hypothetical protein n=1 Tax=Phreatobacter sp. TaxID=1966341 RepID=UPI004035664B